ncbi:hypothetical protein QWY87_11615 [Lutimonas halocynthiae]|uniref:hypothetical protein n=1 Tax=Lutimonas halocynthiae TaxID=1446477 RepID=UPI0025B3C6BF|nr:hypothetical protein [Lutimonas halocynthiae]MDN3643354.1 hypothetical protein [Lutimonas halocynthiae]
MSETPLKNHIDIKKSGSGEYQELYLKGIEYLQSLSSDHWTDFNEHDPGVTILENLVYTLTNLSYKVDLPIKDILKESKNGKLNSGDNGFFVPSEILTTNPITVKDLSKIFIDKILNIKNVWIEAPNAKCKNKNALEQNHLKGLYNIYVELFHYDENTAKLEKEKERVHEETKRLFLEHRNLCEDIYETIILDPIRFQMELDLNLRSNVNGEEILAKIYYKINDYLSHEVKFSSLNDLINKDFGINFIFNGPSLDNGFILNKELKKRKNKIRKKILLSLINENSDIIHIEKFMLKVADTGVDIFLENDQYTFPKNKTALLELPKSNDHLQFRDSDIKFKPDIVELKHAYDYLVSKNYGNYKSVSNAMNIVNIPDGNQLGIRSYHSIREQFPATYGINKYGIPNNASLKRHAQVKQLKAYLLPFDQIMINFLAQLTGIYQLYDANSREFQSYFYGQLKDMLDLKPLVSGYENSKDSDFIIAWQNILESINSRFDTLEIERHSDVTNNLLARFSENIPEYSLENINKESFGNDHERRIFKKEAILSKRKLIANYARLSYYRSRGYNYSMNYDDNVEQKESHATDHTVPSLIQKVAIIMGIQNFNLRFLSDVLSNHKIKLFSLNETETSSSEVFLEVIYLTKGIEIVETVKTEIETSDKYLTHTFCFKGNSENILNSVLKDGIIKDNYTIPEEKPFNIKFTSEESVPEIVHVANSKDKANQAIQFAINQLRIVSQQSEGLYLVEHLLLAPPYHGNHFGYSFVIKVNKDTKLHFIQDQLLSYQRRNEQLNEITLGKRKHINFQYVEAENKFFLQIRNSNDCIIARGTNAFKNLGSINKQIKYLELLNGNTKFRKSIKKLKCYAYYNEGKVNESFFSFGMSIVLPSWPVRFQQLGFRIKFDEVLLETAPAHIAHHTYWLNIEKLHSFELDFYKWMGLKDNCEEKMEYSYKLINKLKEYHHSCQY